MKRSRPWDLPLKNKQGGASLDCGAKKTIVHMYYDQDMDIDDIYPKIPSPRGSGHVQKRTVRDVIQFFDDFGTVEPVGREPKRRKMLPRHVEEMIAVVKAEPYLYLREIAVIMTEKTGVEYNEGRIYFELKSRGHTLKKMRKKARQRDEEKRNRYWQEILGLLGETGTRRMLCFADETSKDTRALRRWRGWGMAADRVEIEEVHFKGKVLSILALYGCEGFLDYDSKEGAYNGDDFFEAAKGMIIPWLGNYERGEDNSILVLDNCTIHKSRLPEFKALVEERGAKLVFLAPYCPIDNPIEKAFNVFKSYWRLEWVFLESLESAEDADTAIEFVMKNCYSGDRAAAALRTYESCGYCY